MSNPKIQVKRTHNNATVPTLSHGELAYQHNGGTAAQEGLLLIGRPGTSSGNEVNDIVGGKIYVDKVTALENVGAEANPDVASSTEINAGTSTAERTFTPAKIKQAVEAHSINTTPTATSSAIGGIKIGYTDNGKNYAVELDADSEAFVNVPWTDTVYTLPEATASAKGGIELFSNTDQSVAANAVTATTGKTYGIQLNSDGQAVVNVPWVNTEYSVGDGGLTQNNFTNADHTKLNSITSGATPTNTTNVTAAGALMDSECTSLASVKALNQGLTTTSNVTFESLQLVDADPQLTFKSSSTSEDDFRIKVEDGDLTLSNQTYIGDPGNSVTNFLHYNQYGLALGNGGANTSGQNGGVSVSGVLYANNSLNVTAGTTLGSTLTQSGNAQIATGTGSTCEIATAGGGVTMGYVTQDNTINGNTTFNHNLTVDGNTILGSDNNDTVTIKGNLEVQGTTTTINSTTLNIEDTELILNSDFTGSTPTASAGLRVERGTKHDARLFWDDTYNTWYLNTPDSEAHNASVSNKAIAHQGNFNALLNVDTNIIDCGTF